MNLSRDYQEIMEKIMKKTFLRVFLVAWITCAYMALSLACTGSTPEPEPTTRITIADVNSVLKNQEVSLLANNGLTAEQLMEVIKLCIKTEEITNISIVEENPKLSYGVLKVDMNIRKNPVSVIFSCSISKSGTLKMRVTNIKSVDKVNAPFSSIVYTKDFDAACVSIKESVLSKLQNIGNTVIVRSSDFA